MAAVGWNDLSIERTSVRFAHRNTDRKEDRKMSSEDRQATTHPGRERSRQSAVLATANATALQPTVNQSGIDYFVYQLPHLNDDAGPRPQLGGMQIDRTVGRIYVNEEVAGHGRVYDISTIAAIGTQTADNDLAIISTSRGNGGSALVERELLVLIV